MPEPHPNASEPSAANAVALGTSADNVEIVGNRGSSDFGNHLIGKSLLAIRELALFPPLDFTTD